MLAVYNTPTHSYVYLKANESLFKQAVSNKKELDMKALCYLVIEHFSYIKVIKNKF